MDRLGEIVRLNDDKLYSQLINYKYRGKAGNRVGQAATIEDPDDEDGLDGLEDKENRTNQDNQSSQSGDSDQLKNEQNHRKKNETCPKEKSKHEKG